GPSRRGRSGRRRSAQAVPPRAGPASTPVRAGREAPLPPPATVSPSGLSLHRCGEASRSAPETPHSAEGMKPRITVITIGVDDLERSLRFYRDGLGLPTQGIVGTEFEHGAVAFFDLQAGVRLALWPRASIAHD